MTLTMVPSECPRFQECSAAVCPLDPVPTYHRQGDRVCYYLVNSGKEGAAERFADDTVFGACVARLPEIAARHPMIGKTVAVGARTGFKGAHFMSGNRKSNILATGQDQ